MRVESVELRRCRLPLREAFRTSYGVETTRDVLLVRVRTDAGNGWGECGAPTRPGYTDETIAIAHAALRDRLVARLAGREVTVAVLDEVLGPAEATPMARAALELALLDAWLRAEHRSLASWLGAERARVPAGIALGIATVDETVARVGRAVVDGYRRVKLKIEPGHDVAVLRVVRAAFPDLALQADANGAYRAVDIDHLRGIDAVDLQCLEQPFPADDLQSHVALADASATPICLDESIGSAADARRAIELGACSVVNIKAARVGGLAEARRIHDVCVASEVDAWCGGMLDTGIARAANVALTALPGCTLAGDVSASDRWFDVELTEPLRLDIDGCIPVPTGPGLGVEIDVAAIESVTTSVELVSLRG
ncbi:MAG TPA: o-succinylbenzoate synthase [Acidimicrobiia bacterium]|nr:o-succinylbenzoate synthase [Acidimicrobiia bacterium]